MKAKILIAAASLMVLLTLSAPAFALKGAQMDTLQFLFYGDQSALYTGLLANQIDMMAWPVTKAQYDFLKGNVSFVVAPYFDLGDYEIGFNNNYTYPGTNYRNPFNYTEFRKAMACLIDKDGLIAGPNVEGFGTRIDTPVARPILDEWVNFDVSKYDKDGNLINKYPWDFNGTKALEILYNNGWFAKNESGWPTWDALLAEYQTPNGLEEYIGTVKGVLYPPGHEKQGQVIDPIEGYSRVDHPPRLAAGVGLENQMKKIGIGVNNHQYTSTGCYGPVMIDSTYHYYTAGWSYGVRPLHFYSMFTPIGIYPGGPNFYLIDNSELTYHATMEYPNATTFAQSKAEALECQRIIVEQAHFVPLFSTRSYYAYRSGLLGVVATKVYGLTDLLDYLMLKVVHENYPTTNTIRFGTAQPPEAINPIFSASLYDYQVIDRIFTGYMTFNPFKPTTPGKSPVGGDQPWMAYDWNYYLGPDGNARVELYFNDFIKWHDGTSFTVDDLEYTIFLGTCYDDSWSYTDMIHVVNFQTINNYHCIISFDMPSIWSIYTCLYDIIPKHIFDKIDIPSPNDYESGHHGYWPGETALEAQVHAPLTYPIDPEETWVGTNMWKYRPGTIVPGVGGGITLDAFRSFFLYTPPKGEIDFVYKWNTTAGPYGGYLGNYIVGLPDLVLLGNAYGTSGNGEVPFSIGRRGDWEPACDIAASSCKIGSSDFRQLVTDYFATWGYDRTEGRGPPEPPYVKVVPSIVEVGPEYVVGQTFTVEAVVENLDSLNAISGIVGVEVHLTWNKTLIRPVSFTNRLGTSGGVLEGPSITYTIGPGFFDELGNPVSGPPYTNAGQYRVAAESTSGNWWGTGTVVEITFEVIYQPIVPEPSASCTLELTYTDLYDEYEEHIPHEVENGYYEVSPYNPPNPLVRVAPSIVEVGPEYAVGQSFTITIMVENIHAMKVPAGLNGFEVHLSWNKTLIQPLSFTDRLGASDGVLNPPLVYAPNFIGFYDDLGNRLSGPPYTNATEFRIAAASTDGPWWGNGKAVEITFQVVYQPVMPEPAASCILNLAFTELVDSEYHHIDHMRKNGYYKILPVGRDIKVVSIVNSKTSVGLGYMVQTNVTVANVGTAPETFNVTLYANTTEIGNQTILNLINGTSTLITFNWNTSILGYGNYTISAYAWPVVVETNTANNLCTDGLVTVTLPADLNGDSSVGLTDLVILAKAWGSKPGDPNWNPNADINGDGSIGLIDLVIMAQHYGQ